MTPPFEETTNEGAADETPANETPSNLPPAKKKSRLSLTKKTPATTDKTQPRLDSRNEPFGELSNEPCARRPTKAKIVTTKKKTPKENHVPNDPEQPQQQSDHQDPYVQLDGVEMQQGVQSDIAVMEAECISFLKTMKRRYATISFDPQNEATDPAGPKEKLRKVVEEMDRTKKELKDLDPMHKAHKGVLAKNRDRQFVMTNLSLKLGGKQSELKEAEAEYQKKQEEVADLKAKQDGATASFEAADKEYAKIFEIEREAKRKLTTAKTTLTNLKKKQGEAVGGLKEKKVRVEECKKAFETAQAQVQKASFLILIPFCI